MDHVTILGPYLLEHTYTVVHPRVVKHRVLGLHLDRVDISEVREDRLKTAPERLVGLRQVQQVLRGTKEVLLNTAM